MGRKKKAEQKTEQAVGPVVDLITESVAEPVTADALDSTCDSLATTEGVVAGTTLLEPMTSLAADQEPAVPAGDSEPAVPAGDSETDSETIAPLPAPPAPPAVNAIRQMRPAYDPTDWLARIQDQNQIVIDAATELESAKVVARNRKKSYDAAAELLSALIAQQKAEQDDWNRPLPLFDGQTANKSKATDIAADGTAGGDAIDKALPNPVGSIPDADLANAWRFASIAELELPGKLAQKLEDDAGVKTIGELEDLRGGAGLNSIKGIGPGKITIIEDAVVNWLSVQRDAKALASAAGSNGQANDNGHHHEPGELQGEAVMNASADADGVAATVDDAVTIPMADDNDDF